MLKIYVVCAAVLLSGCALTPEQEQARFEAEVQHMRTTYGPGCLAFGEDRSPAWIRCVMDADDRARVARAQRAAAAAVFGQAMQNYGQTRYGPEATRAQQFPTYQAPVYREPIRCQTIGMNTVCQ